MSRVQSEVIMTEPFLKSKEIIMPAISFDKNFADHVKKGLKRSSIGKERHTPGDQLYLYEGKKGEQKECLGIHECVSCEPIMINEHMGDVTMLSREKYLNVAEMYQLARDIGFKGRLDFVEYFRKRYKLPFVGFVTKW
jgi:hypothetical protein